MKDHLHPDAAPLDRLGFGPIKAHFNISRQAFAYWRKKGVPKMHRNTLLMLGAVNGKPLPEFQEDRA